MNTRKEELRGIVLNILTGKEPVTYNPSQLTSLTASVAEVLARQHNKPQHSASLFRPEQQLNENDWQLVQEIFWDLICQRVITPGMNSANPNLPWFRVHAGD